MTDLVTFYETVRGEAVALCCDPLAIWNLVPSGFPGRVKSLAVYDKWGPSMMNA